MNKNNLKVIVMFVLLFLLSGCTVDVNLTVNDKYEVKESSSIRINNDIILLSNDTIDEYLESLMLSYSTSSYELKKISGDEESGIDFSLDYAGIENYIEVSNYDSLYADAYINIENDSLYFETTDNFYDQLFEESPDPLSPELKEIKINIKFYNEVIENNADSYDEQNNIYTWKITKEEQPESIYFKTSKKIRYDIMFKDLFSQYVIYGFIVLSLLICGIIFVIFLKKRIKANNEI